MNGFQYKAPSDTKTRGLVTQVGDDLMEKIKERLQRPRRLAATIDGWSSKNYNDSYLGKSLQMFELPFK